MIIERFEGRGKATLKLAVRSQAREGEAKDFNNLNTLDVLAFSSSTSVEFSTNFKNEENRIPSTADRGRPIGQTG